MIIEGTPLAGAGRVLFLHAHPDDETIATGALIAGLSAAGVAVAVLTATRGERGEVVEGSLPAGLDEEQLSAAREAELAAALVELGVGAPSYLGSPPARAAGLAPRRYRDSGMRWIRPGLAGPLADSGPEALTAADRTELLNDLLAMIDYFRPQLLITYDSAGGYGHPDHVLLHHVGRAAGVRAGIAVAELVDDPQNGHTIAADDHRDALVRALRRHASQLTVDGSEIVHVGGQREPIMTRVGLRLAPP